MQREREPICMVIPGAASYQGKQGLSYHKGISAESANAGALCMHLVTIPPGGRAKPHLHEGHESALYVLSGEAGMCNRAARGGRSGASRSARGCTRSSGRA
jgi:uncharacterized RmlC-like cupin family protein